MQHTRFPKPIEAYKVLSFFGSNIVITEGAEWKKHRKVAAPTFTDVRLLLFIIIIII